jgi:transposase
MVFVYEAGPCGYAICRMLKGRGHECWVVAPSNTPRRVRDRIKTDRRDCLKLAGLARAGELEPIYVPDPLDEAMGDLVRAREDAVLMQRQARHRLGALLSRNDIRYVGKSPWTEAHRHWIARLVLPNPAQRIAFEEYVQAVHECTKRVRRLTASIEAELTKPRLPTRPIFADGCPWATRRRCAHVDLQFSRCIVVGCRRQHAMSM